MDSQQSPNPHGFVAGKSYSMIPPVESASLPQAGNEWEINKFAEGRCLGPAGNGKYTFIGIPIGGVEERYFVADPKKDPAVEHPPHVQHARGFRRRTG